LLPIDLNQEGLNSIFLSFKPYFKPSMIQGIGKGWSKWGETFII